MRVFEKKSGNLKNHQIFSFEIYKVSKAYFPKPSNVKKLIKNPLKSG